MRLPLTGGSYTTRSVIASAQRCINYYSEINPKGNIVPVTHYQRPGLDPLFTVGSGPIRALYRASNEVGYCVSGNQLFSIDWNNATVALGTIGTNSGPVSLADNGVTLVLADGSSTGYQLTLNTTDFSAINDTTGTFKGANQWQFLDTYLIWNMPGTQDFGSTLSDSVTFDPLYFARKLAYPDKLKAIWVNRKEIFLFGDVKSEIWYDAGGTTDSPFAFVPLPGTYIEHGIAAPFSRNSHDITVFWLSRSLQGEGIVLSFRGYFANRISNHALEDAIKKMQASVGISDARGFCYQIDGHQFYMLTFPRGDQTWVYDMAVQDPNAAWHQEGWTDPVSGALHRSRIGTMAFINGYNMAGDWENNTVYSLNLDKYTDRVNGVECPIVCTRSFPHIGAARSGNGMVEVDGRRLQFSAFRADMECGTAPLDTAGNPAQVSLRWSDDRGRTFGNALLQSGGAPGEYLTQPQWLGMGIARDRIFELSHNIAGPAALNGAWVDAEVLGT